MATGNLILVNGKLGFMLQPGGFEPRKLVLDNGYRPPTVTDAGGNPVSYSSLFTTPPDCYIRVYDSTGTLVYDNAVQPQVRGSDGNLYTPSRNLTVAPYGKMASLKGSATFEVKSYSYSGLSVSDTAIVGFVEAGFDSSGRRLISPIVKYKTAIVNHAYDGFARYSCEVCWPLNDLAYYPCKTGPLVTVTRPCGTIDIIQERTIVENIHIVTNYSVTRRSGIFYVDGTPAESISGDYSVPAWQLHGYVYEYELTDQNGNVISGRNAIDQPTNPDVERTATDDFVSYYGYIAISNISFPMSDS